MTTEFLRNWMQNALGHAARSSNQACQSFDECEIAFIAQQNVRMCETPRSSADLLNEDTVLVRKLFHQNFVQTQRCQIVLEINIFLPLKPCKVSKQSV